MPTKSGTRPQVPNSLGVNSLARMMDTANWSLAPPSTQVARQLLLEIVEEVSDSCSAGSFGSLSSNGRLPDPELPRRCPFS